MVNIEIEQKLQRFLTTIARRQGINKIVVGAVITDGKNIIIDSNSNAFPKKEVDSNINEALTVIVEDFRIENFSIIKYVGGFDFRNENNETVRQYNFEITVGQMPLKHSTINSIMQIINIENNLPEFLNQKETKILALLIEQRKERKIKKEKKGFIPSSMR